MKWCLKQNDLDNWHNDKFSQQDNMIYNNDNDFKYWLTGINIMFDIKKIHLRHIKVKIKVFSNSTIFILENHSFFSEID